jgi:2-amino-4-hydroxy-6-hydroxymethyldihydropteridine diphosphokinase
MFTQVYIGVGSNLGDRNQAIVEARDILSRKEEIQFKRSAPIYETDPVGGPAQGRYLNTVWEIETSLAADDLLNVLLEVERDLGRTRAEKNGPRAIDLDLLFYGDQVIQKPHLTVPHLRIQDRWFVLKPMWDLRADLVHPKLEKSVCELLDQINEAYPKS